MPCGPRAGNRGAGSRRPCIDPVVLALRRRASPQHQRVRHLQLFRMRKQLIVNLAGEGRRFHSDHPALRNGSDPGVQLAPCSIRSGIPGGYGL